VHWSRRYEPLVTARDRLIKEALRNEGCEVRSFNAALLVEPWDVQNLSGKPFQVFTPFWRKVSTTLWSRPRRCRRRSALRHRLAGRRRRALESLDLLPRIAW
jgi:deoxyribodipyrimidine photo-lyase